MPRKNVKNWSRRNQKGTFRFNTLDWLCVAFGIVMSIISVFVDREHSLIYLVVSAVMLICGIMELVLGIKGRRSNYVFAIMSAFATAYVAWNDQFYGNMMINFFYVTISVVGFYLWGKHRDKKKNVIARKLSVFQIIIVGLVFVVSSVGFGIVLWKTGGHAVVFDSMSTILVIFASMLGALRYREQWVLWGMVDTLALIMWIETGNLAAVALRAFYVVGSIYGYYKWRDFIKKKTN